jgi:ribosomal protein S7
MLKNKNKNLNLYSKILGFITKKGKKVVARKLLSYSLFNVGLFFNKPIYYILLKFFKKINIFIETKIVKIKRSRYIVPFPINLNRRIYLIIKWLVFVISKNKERISFSKKFAKQIIAVYSNQKSEIINLKNLNISQAVLNRSNIHYRW